MLQTIAKVTLTAIAAAEILAAPLTSFTFAPLM